MNNKLYTNTKISGLSVEILPHELVRDVDAIILEKVKVKYGNRCYRAEGYVNANSIEVIDRSTPENIGSTTNGLLVCQDVSIKANVYRPVIGSIVTCRVISKIDTAYYAVDGPIFVFIEREPNMSLEVGDRARVSVLNIEITEKQIGVYGTLDSKIEDVNYRQLPEIIESDAGIVFRNPVTILDKATDIQFNEDLGDRDVLVSAKDLIDPIEAKKMWSTIKAFVNPFEMVDPSSALKQEGVVDQKKMPYKEVISRAYYKMWEIVHDKDSEKWGGILEQYSDRPITVLNMAEAPGGFVQASIDARIRSTTPEILKKDKYRAITLYDENDRSVPNWNEKILEFYKSKYGVDLVYSYGKENGDLTKAEEHIFTQKELMEGEKAELITSDGGIDVSDDYNTQEVLNHKLFFGEIIIALANQKEGGTYIMKIYDIYTDLTMEFMALLKRYYNDVFIIKPNLSRPANSEKYVVCLGYNGKFTEKDHKSSLNMLTKWGDKYVYDLFVSYVGEDFKSAIAEFNNDFAKKQINTIQNGVELFNSGNIGDPDTQIEYKTIQKIKSTKWCEQHYIPTKDVKLTSRKFTVK